MNISKGDLLFISALILAVWFAFAGTVWVYWMALIFGYPAGLISLILWNVGRKTDHKPKRYKIILIVLGIGLLLSLSVLAYLLIYD